MNIIKSQIKSNNMFEIATVENQYCVSVGVMVSTGSTFSQHYTKLSTIKQKVNTRLLKYNIKTTKYGPFVWGIHWPLVDSPIEGPIIRKISPWQSDQEVIPVNQEVLDESLQSSQTLSQNTLLNIESPTWY